MLWVWYQDLPLRQDLVLRGGLSKNGQNRVPDLRHTSVFHAPPVCERARATWLSQLLHALWTSRWWEGADQV